MDFLKRLATDAGRICLEGSEHLSASDVEFKNPRDLVTVVDKKVEEYIISEIKKVYPDHGIIGEETGRTETDGDCWWIIDPIDGTTSFVHGQPYYAVSIAFRKGGELQAGVVHAPVLGQLFWAEKGKGAYLNGRKIQVSSTMRMQEAVLGTGFACLRAGWKKNNMTYLNRIMPAIRDIRRCGSAAIDLAYVAAGKFDGFWEMNLNIYDIAAGVLLVTEAGGGVCDFSGGSAYPEAGIVATNGRITVELLIPICIQDDILVKCCHGGEPWQEKYQSTLKTYKEPKNYVTKLPRLVNTGKPCLSYWSPNMA